jgi:hypothetical protein
MTILQAMDGKFYDVPDEDVVSFEVPRERLKALLEKAGLPVPQGGPGPGQAPGQRPPHRWLCRYSPRSPRPAASDSPDRVVRVRPLIKAKVGTGTSIHTGGGGTLHITGRGITVGATGSRIPDRPLARLTGALARKGWDSLPPLFVRCSTRTTLLRC